MRTVKGLAGSVVVKAGITVKNVLVDSAGSGDVTIGGVCPGACRCERVQALRGSIGFPGPNDGHATRMSPSAIACISHSSAEPSLIIPASCSPRLAQQLTIQWPPEASTSR